MFETITFFDTQTITQLGWALAQASVIAVAAYLLVVLARTITPAARVHVSLLGLLLMALVPTALLVFAKLSLSDGWSLGQLFQASSPPEMIATQGSELSAAASSLSTTGEMTPWQEFSIRASELFVNRVKPQSSNIDAAATEVSRSQEPSRIIPIVLLGAVACVLFGLARLLAGYWQINRLRASSMPIHDPQLLADLAECKERLGVRVRVTAAETHSLGSAAIVGWRRPVLLLPTDWKSWTCEERDAVLAHELAHVKRRDYVSTAIGQLAVAINFYHPLAHVVMQRLRLDQELAADSLASEVVGGQQRYVEILAGLALRKTQVRTPGPCQAFLPPRRMFIRRLEMLRTLPQSRPWMNRCYSAVAAVCLVFVATLATGLRPHTLIAQEVSGGAENTRTQTSVASYVPTGLWETVVCVDVQAALATEVVQSILKQANLPKQFEQQGYKIDRDEISEVAFVVMFAEGRAADPLMILRSKKSIADAPQVPQIRKLDDNTLAFHSRPEMLGLLGVGSGDKTLQELLDRNDQSHVRIASKTNWMQKLAKQEGDQGPAMAFAPLWTKVDSASLGVTLSDNLDIVAQLDSTDPKRVEETLTAAKFLIRNYLDGISQLKGEPGGDPTQRVMAAAAAQAGNQLIDSIKINSDANQLMVTAQMPNAVYKMIGLALPAVSSARTAAQRVQSMNNMKQLLLAFHNYHDAHGHLPAAVVVDEASGAKRSWRVEILPYLEQAELYAQYRKDQPWDSEANKLVLQKMPQVFAVAGMTGSNLTPYQAIVSEDGGLTMSEGQLPHFRDFRDGLSNTTIIVETKILAPWTQPVDLSDTATLPQLGTSRSSDPGIIVGMADGSVRFLSKDIDPNTWKALTTRSGRENVSID